ncbi:hypothetical protein MTR_3g066010 [Medicago truncatula]|uniref:Uncharacterized protein n=1 Tax=Medicago truncatula TaxID=3880 RepID=A0A072UYV2_MEDTR|nr:hypothetical protein MTR_3g066010 [Medicago truncatula]
MDLNIIADNKHKLEYDSGTLGALITRFCPTNSGPGGSQFTTTTLALESSPIMVYLFHIHQSQQ